MFDDYNEQPKHVIANTLITYFTRHQALEFYLKAPQLYAKLCKQFRRGLLTKREFVERIQLWWFYYAQEAGLCK